MARDKDLPAHVRGRVRDAIDGLHGNPRPTDSKLLTVPGLQLELRRLRVERWRVIYAISGDETAVDILAVRKRPPYDYGDFQSFLGQIT